MQITSVTYGDEEKAYYTPTTTLHVTCHI